MSSKSWATGTPVLTLINGESVLLTPRAFYFHTRRKTKPLTNEEIEAICQPCKNYTLGMELANAMSKRLNEAVMYGADIGRDEYFKKVSEIRLTLLNGGI